MTEESRVEREHKDAEINRVRRRIPNSVPERRVTIASNTKGDRADDGTAYGAYSGQIGQRFRYDPGLGGRFTPD